MQIQVVKCISFDVMELQSIQIKLIQAIFPFLYPLKTFSGGIEMKLA